MSYLDFLALTLVLVDGSMVDDTEFTNHGVEFHLEVSKRISWMAVLLVLLRLAALAYFRYFAFFVRLLRAAFSFPTLD